MTNPEYTPLMTGREHEALDEFMREKNGLWLKPILIEESQVVVAAAARLSVHGNNKTISAEELVMTVGLNPKGEDPQLPLIIKQHFYNLDGTTQHKTRDTLTSRYYRLALPGAGGSKNMDSQVRASQPIALIAFLNILGHTPERDDAYVSPKARQLFGMLIDAGLDVHPSTAAALSAHK